MFVERNKEVKINLQKALAIVVIAVATLALIFSKKIFKFPSCYWPYRIYVILVVVLWAISQVPLLCP